MSRSRDRDALFAASGMIEGLPSNLAAESDRYLRETYVIETPRPRGRRKATRVRVRR